MSDPTTPPTRCFPAGGNAPILPDGMAVRSDGAVWNARPRPDLSDFGRRAYLAGYSDGFHGYPFGAGDDGSLGGFSDYRPGFADGLADANPSNATHAALSIARGES